MINKFDVYFEKNDISQERNNIYASDVLDIFNSIDWLKEQKECIKSEDEFGSFISIVYKDTAGLEYSFELELYVDDNNKRQEMPLNFSLSYLYQETEIHKILFGLLGERSEIKNKNIFMDDQNMDFTMKCLNAFLKHNHEFLKNNMYENFSSDLKE